MENGILQTVMRTIIMNRKDIVDAIQEFMVNSNVDPDSNLFKQALDALIAINLKQIED